MKRKRQECYERTIGTPAYEKNKEQMRKISQARRTKIAGTPEHEKFK